MEGRYLFRYNGILVWCMRHQRITGDLSEMERGIHWEDLDEDISVEGLIAGRPSGESQESFKKWLEKRKKKNF